MKPSADRLKTSASRSFQYGFAVWSTGLGCALLVGGLLWLLPKRLLTPSHLAAGLLFGLLGLAAGNWLRQRQVTHTLQIHRSTSEKYQRLAFYDQLTGLPNRSLLRDRLEQYLAEAKRFGHLMGVMFLDLDRFKYINDSMGHAAGDALLQMAAKRMQNCLRNNDTVARFAGDEFVIILSGFRDLQNVPYIAQKLLRTLAEPYLVDGSEVFTTASLGIAIYPEDGTSAERLMRNADTAMYAAKDANGNTYRLFSLEMDRKLTQRLEMETALRQALLRNEFQLLYQPQFDMRNGQLVGVEALVRWNHPEKGLLPPDSFIQLAEETGLIAPLGEWILGEACRQWHLWPPVGGRPLRLAINLTSRQFKQDGLVAEITALLETTGLPADCLELEITEGTLMQHAELAGPLLRELKALGVHLSIDDFGSGYFSLAYLQNLPIDRLKIDPAFVQGGPGDKGHATIITTIIDLARNMNLELIAEGVESAGQIEFLLRKGCHIGQGYYFAEPLDDDGISDFIARPPALPPENIDEASTRSTSARIH
jgi:diguanylate cyclase (GGDEF)-like protein